MPEGDTIHKLANYFAPRLEGQTVLGLTLPDAEGARRCTGRRIQRVFARGKHLFFELDEALLIRTHLGMYGSWHRYRPEERWRKPRHRASLVLTTADEVYVCFNAKEVELVAAPGVRERILSTRLGPDLVDPAVDLTTVVRRAREFLPGDAPLADVLLDQRVAAGIGNVYKSEVLFIEGQLPQTPQSAIGDQTLRDAFALASRLLRRNLGGGPRVTRFEPDAAGRLWVYGRRGRPCLRCEGTVEGARFGAGNRATFWCPGCQHA
jgi:endonuclease-8